MASRDGGSSESDIDDVDDSGSESDIDLNYHEDLGDFSSDTDSGDDDNTQSSLGTFSSQVSDCKGDDFWSTELRPVSISAFDEDTGPSHDLQPDDNLLQYFNLFINDDFFNHIAEQTNLYAQQQNARNWTDTTSEEMKAYIGLHILMGINQLPSVDMYWSENRFIGNQGFKDTMSRNRYDALTRYIHVNDNTQQAPVNSPNYDRLHKIRPLIDLTRTEFKKHYLPGMCQSIDEGMIRYKGQHYAKQYAPCKPIKRGLKVWMRCEPNGYTHDYRIYLGKHDSMSGKDLGERVVKHLCKPLKWKGHHVFFDRYFTSVPLLQTLENNGIYACGTIMSNRIGFPAALKNPALNGRGDAEQLQHDNIVATVWKDSKPVHFVSTTSNPLGDGPTHRRIPGGGVILIQRPPAVQHYQEHYSGVDRAMQYRSKYPVGRPSKKYWKYFFNFILEVTLINTFLLWLATPETVKPRKHFSVLDSNIVIANSLIGDFSSRKKSRHVSTTVGVSAAGLINHQESRLERARGRCKTCADAGRRRDVQFGCSLCNVHLCKGACFQAYHAKYDLQTI